MASRYWVGGTATWDATAGTKWATTSGGAGGATAPTSADDVFFDAASGVVTVTVANGVVAQSLDCTGFTGTLASSASATWTIGGTVSGSFKLVSGMTFTANSSTIVFASGGGATYSVLTGGKTLANVTINTNTTTTVRLDDSLTASGTITLTQGILNTNGQTCSWAIFSSVNSNTRTLTMGSSAITLTSTGTAWNTSTFTNLTITSNTSVVTLTGANATWFGGSGFNTNGGSIVLSGSGTATVANSFTCANLTRTGTAAKTDALQFNGGNTTITGTLTITGNSTINRIQAQSLTPGTSVRVSAAAVSLTHVDFRDIAAGGTAIPWTGTSLGDSQGNNGNITFTTAATQTWQGTTGGSWSDSAKWTSRVPLPQDDVIINAAFSASQTITIDMPRLGKNITWTGVSGNPTWSQTVSSGSYIYGNWTGSANTTRGGWTGGLFFAGRSNHTITTDLNTNNMPGSIFTAPGGTYTLQDSYNTGGGGLTLTEGTLTTNNNPITTTSFTGTGTNARTLNLGSSIVTLTASSGNPFLVSTWTNFTFNADTSTLIISDTGANTKAFIASGATATFYNIQVTGGGTGAVIFTFGALQKNINTLTINGPKTIQFSGSSITSLNNLIINSSPGNVVTMSSATAATAFTLTKASGIVMCDYLSLQDSAATGGATWYAGSHSTNVSGNSGWIFNTPSDFLQMF